eukprot:TRINITY_DN6848_c0_g2_i1.p1 TRINITY_DN6848_c0_g2~~TRINITY_DN6848_c0_g2_i1.p1  ORF type:complete len:115 (+),score=11.37 TRINITY_DN6848_c0_g2_i1:85-429(+)
MAELLNHDKSYSGTQLLAASRIIDRACFSSSIAYVACKARNPDPEACIILAKQLTGCANGMLAIVTKSCTEDFEKVTSCLYSKNQDLSRCRPELTAFEKCAATVSPSPSPSLKK